MTEKRARALHRAMWRWLAKHPGKWKEDWPWWMMDDYVVQWCPSCFALEFLVANCEDCPTKGKLGDCEYKSSLFGKCLDMRDNPRIDPADWADVCNRMADAWREIPEGR